MQNEYHIENQANHVDDHAQGTPYVGHEHEIFLVVRV
jgi:hypothetical protein